MRVSDKDLINFANSFADLSGTILNKSYLKNHDLEEKKDGSFVTNIDKEIELLFRKKIKKVFPTHSVLGEEFGLDDKKSEYLWVIDPLDGTHNFIAGKPLFGTVISCLKENKPILGLIDIPILKQRWHGGKNIGVKFNNKICKFNFFKKNYSRLIVSSTSLLMFDKFYEKKVKNIYNRIGFPIFGSDCYSYGLLLSGRIDQIIEANMKPWDYLAQVALINEQGGIITDWEGKPLTTKSDGKVIASIESKHHKRTLSYLNK